MSQNTLNISGTIEFISWKPAGSTARSGNVSRWPRLSIRFSFQPVPVFMNGQQFMLDDQKIWVSLSVPQVRGQGGGNNPPDEQKINGFIQGKESGTGGNALLTDGTYHVWGNPPKPEVKVGFHNLLTGQHVLANLNRCVVEGKVHSQSDQWVYIEESYSVPGRGQNRQMEWKSRIIPVFLQSPIAPLPTKRRVLAFGALSSRSLSGMGSSISSRTSSTSSPRRFTHVSELDPSVLARRRSLQ